MNILSQEYFILFSAVLIVVSFLYSSVGHGGASGYLALMAIFGFPMLFIKPTALVMNIFVAGISFFFFAKSDYFKWKLFMPFALTSIPAAFIGGSIEINPVLYKQILGVFILMAILRMMGVFGKHETGNKTIKFLPALFIGFAIGLFSGMIGIGGGIILSPIILLLGWGNVKETAAVSALFILVNSVSGLIGFGLAGNTIPTQALLFLPMILLGGSLGAYYGSKKFSHLNLGYLLQFVLFLAFIKLMII